VLEEDIVCTAEQRFIVRSYSPLVTIGGGRVVFPYARKPRGAADRKLSADRVRALSAAGAEERFALLVEQGGLLEFDQAAAAIQEPPDGLSAIAARALKGQADRLTELKGDKPVYLSRARLGELAGAVSAALRAYHEACASEAGMPIDDLARAGLKNIPGKTARALLSFLAERGDIAAEDGKARLPGFVPRNDEAFRKNSEALLVRCRQRGFQPPTLDELRAELQMDERAFSLLIQSLKNSRRVALLSGGFLLSDEVEKELRDVLPRIEGEVTLASVRDLTDSSRKYILPILEYFDSKGYTRRVGNVRVVKRDSGEA
jgi:selenocysteine-specific elongation factor